MRKKIYILNGTGSAGKGTFASYLNKYISTCNYSIVNLTKEAAKILGWNGGKTEKDRRFLSDLMDLSAEYNDMPFCDVSALVQDFNKNNIDTNVLLIDMRDPKDIARAVKSFGAETILIYNPGIKTIESNHADANVNDYEYDYTIINDGDLSQLEKAARFFAEKVIVGNKHDIRKIFCSEM